MIHQINEECGCGAKFTYSGDMSSVSTSTAAAWRADHQHIVTPKLADDLAAKTAELAYRAARMDEEAAAMRRDVAKRQLRAHMAEETR